MTFRNPVSILGVSGRGLILWLLFAVLAGVAGLLPPIPQPPSYHQFADRSACFGARHCLDTVSNLAFVLAGLAGLRFLAGEGARRAFADVREALPYRAFFFATALIGLASGYYHLAPDNGRLAWDRAAMALAFMSWFAAILGERVGVAWARRLLPWLLAAGLGSIAYWAWSESVGRGDLRAWGLMQLVPMLFAPLLLRLYPAPYGARDVLAVLGLYVVALACDFLDRPIAMATGIVSGHTLKHIVAAGAAYRVLAGLQRRCRP